MKATDKNNIQLISDQELEQVSGGLLGRYADAMLDQKCLSLETSKACESMSAGMCQWINGQCVPR